MEMIDNHLGKREIIMFVYFGTLLSSAEETSVGHKAHVPYARFFDIQRT